MERLYLVDTHCHLWHPEFSSDLREVIKEAQKEGVRYLVNVGVDIDTSRKAVESASRYRCVYATVGIHPHYAKDFSPSDLKDLPKLLKRRKVVGMGEVGLDFYREISNRKDQIKLFKGMLEIWMRWGTGPIIIHNREAGDEVLNLVDKVREGSSKVIMHCFSGDRQFLEECLKRGYFISYATNLTYNEGLQELARYTPLERLLLETDSPYLAPASYRGKRNQPSYLWESVKVVAKLKEVEEEDILRSLMVNVKKVFGIGDITLKPRIVYRYKGNLYLNITNRCTNNCSFCFRFHTDCFAGYKLKLEKEPTLRQILKELKGEGLREGITFCGFGEPFLRFDILKRVAQEVKKSNLKVRVVTNGQGNLINDRNVLKELKGLVDKISVSLNVEDEGKYNRLCKPKFGDRTFKGVLEFVREAKRYIPEVEVTFLRLPGVDEKRCGELARDLGVHFRMRSLELIFPLEGVK